MCGIAGVFDVSGGPIDRLEDRLRHMNALQRHRGPDGQRIWTNPSASAGLGHVRLSVVDLQGGAQPMADRLAGLTIVFNGEIYNYRELRSRLAPRQSFVTRSDTEVILNAFREWGPACVNHLRGMFAFAIWDERKRALFLARDRFGIKPLYTAWVGERFYFASEVKALLPFLADVRLDYCGLRDYLTFQFYLQGKTLFRDVREIPPATSCLVDAEGERATTYWQVNYDLDLDHNDAWFCNRCSELVEDSVRAHLVADVPVGSYLSGGIDSSALAALARRLHGPGEFMGFHGRFDEGPCYDESPLPATCPAGRHHAAGNDDHQPGFSRRLRQADLPPGLSGGRAGVVPAVHGVAIGQGPCARWSSAGRGVTRFSAATSAT